jgi:hypothetical protein
MSRNAYPVNFTETPFSFSDSKEKSDGIPQFEVKFGVEE